MDLENRLELIARNTAEIVTEEELRQLLQTKKSPATYCGYELSGEVHLGHLVTVAKLRDLEKAGVKVKILLADWHTWLNKKFDWPEIKVQAKTWQKAFSALGLKKPEFVLGSSFQMKREYFEDVLTCSQHTTLNRALRSMQELIRDPEHAAVSQMIYPLMQIVDIKHLEVDIAQAGIEQRKIHMLGREIMHHINGPKFVCVHTPLINALQGPDAKGAAGKMSSSKPETLISVRDSEDAVREKLKKAYCPEGVAENNPVLEIAKLVVFPFAGSLDVERPVQFGGNVSFSGYDEAEKAFAERKLHPLDLKNAVTGGLNKVLAPVRKVFGVKG